MSIRKGKLPPTSLLVHSGEFNEQDEYSSQDGADFKQRSVWGRAWKRSTWILAAGFAALIIVSSMKLVLPAGRTPKRATSASLTTTTSKVHLRKVLTESQQQCTVWIAPSSLKGVDGYGIFTTRDLQAGERILPSHDGVGVPVESYSTSKTDPYVKQRKDWTRVWKNYWWARGVPDHVAYEGALDSVDYQIGFGALPNHHCLLAALTIQYPTNAYDDSMVDRYRDAATGAFSYNMGREFLVTKPLEAGAEIFLNYGYCQHDRHLPDWTANIYMTEDFDAAVSLIGAYKRKAESPIDYDARGRLQVKDSTKVSKLVKELLPQKKRDFEKLVDGTVRRDTLALRVAQNSLNKRSPDWLRYNGMCMENIIPKLSTIPHAGQGAFANFNLAKNEIIAPAPLMQIVDEHALNIYSSDGMRNGTQLLINYCFGHKESTLLLCPNTNAVLINHCSSRTKKCGPGGPNARYQWSSGWDPTSDEWRTMTLEELVKKEGRGLAFEIVAIRDIRQGDEIFIDYGPEWENAWDDHVATWKPPRRDESFITVKEANEQQNRSIFKSQMSGNLRKTAIDGHSHMFTGCVYSASEDDDDVVYHQNMDWEKLSDGDIMKRYADDGSDYRYFRRGGYARHGDKVHWPCTVIRQHARNNGTYVVRIHQSPFAWRTGEMAWHRHNLPRLLYNYPRESIHYFKLPFKSDQHLPGVFRRPIGIRDELFPEQWRNLADGDHH